jgi:alkanesulfonate monooxygenase SsuD/methylene tetrahydromethanopterin reductase-like flavin-dependent oxidoreductase (luciferase family)
MDDVARATRTRVNGISYLLVASVAWGINWSLVKFLLSEVPPLSGRAIAVIGAAVTIGFAAMRGETLIPPTNRLPRLLIAAALNCARANAERSGDRVEMVMIAHAVIMARFTIAPTRFAENELGDL